MKMYILIRDDVPLGYAMVAVAHASLACYLRFRDDPEVKQWLDGPFYKVVCKANAKEFARAKNDPGAVVLTESALGGDEVAVALKPRAEHPRWCRFLQLYR
jgi:peptidyl-tRNA hydrolase